MDLSARSCSPITPVATHVGGAAWNCAATAPSKPPIAVSSSIGSEAQAPGCRAQAWQSHSCNCLQRTTSDAHLYRYGPATIESPAAEPMRQFPRLLRYLSLAVLSGYSLAGVAQPGYADLVRRVAPSVVTVLAEEQGQGAAQRAADRAIQRSDSETDTMRAMVQRLLAGPGGTPDFAQATEVLGPG